MRPAKADWLILSLLLLLEAGLIWRYWTPQEPGQSVLVQSPSGAHRLDLRRDGRHTVPGALGDSVLEVRDGAVRFADSPCRRKLCVHSGWHHRTGGSMACVPNRISLSIEGGKPTFDALHQ